MPKKPMLVNLTVEPEEQQTSYSFSNCGKELYFRAYLFRNGTVLREDGSTFDNVVKEEELDWDTKKFISKGISGSVYYVVHKVTGQPFAVKSISITTKVHRDEVNAELTVLTSPSSSNHIVRTFGAFWESDDNAVSIVMEWMAFSLHDIHSFCKGLEENVVRDIALQLVYGTNYLHRERKVIHRDIKPKNVLVSGDGYVKLSDFGVAKVISTLSEKGMGTYIGTELYMAPERLDAGGYGFTSDVWSIGVTLVACAIGGSPWPSDISVFQLVMRMKSGDVPKFPAKYSAAAQEFLALCFEADPDKRASCEDLLRHRFLANRTIEQSRDALKELLPVIAELANNARIQQEQLEGDRSERAKQMLANSDLPQEDD